VLLKIISKSQLDFSEDYAIFRDEFGYILNCMSEKRPANFDPEKVAPNFVAFLRTKGEVTFTEDAEPAHGFGIVWERTIMGMQKGVRLNGVRIGSLSYFQEPPAVGYEGKVPGFRKKRYRKDSPHYDLENINLSYNGEHLEIVRAGRRDGWREIPFP
jgi:hypothetical protein